MGQLLRRTSFGREQVQLQNYVSFVEKRETTVMVVKVLIISNKTQFWCDYIYKVYFSAKNLTCSNSRAPTMNISICFILIEAIENQKKNTDCRMLKIELIYRQNAVKIYKFHILCRMLYCVKLIVSISCQTMIRVDVQSNSETQKLMIKSSFHLVYFICAYNKFTF